MLLSAVAVAALGLLTPGTTSGFVAEIRNSTNTAKIATYYQCARSSVATELGGADALFVWPLTETSGTSAADISGRSNSGSYQGSRGSDVTTPRACPRDTSSIVYQLDGQSSWLLFPTQQVSPGPRVFTLSVWFKTTSASGRLFGYGSSATGTSSNYDRVVYIDRDGRLRFGIYNSDYAAACGSSNCTIQSAAAVNDGSWHHVAATLDGSGGSNPGMRLYLDGRLVGAGASFTTPESFSGFWRVGFGGLTGWPSTQTPYYFKGSMRYAAIYTTALTPEQTAEQYASGSGS